MTSLLDLAFVLSDPGHDSGGPGEVPFLLKKSLGKTEGPVSNQTKIQFKKKIFSL
jgi:hypothetical protein